MPGQPSREELALRAEVDRLRLENQILLAEAEAAGSPGAAARQLWRAAWQRFYIARWHLLHLRDPRRGLRLRDDEEHQPYMLRPLQRPMTDRPRILHFIGNFHTGGSARLIVDLIEHLGHRFDQKIVTRSLPPRPAYTGPDGIPRRTLRRSSQLRAALHHFRPDLVHVHMLGHQYDEYGRRDWSWYHKVFLEVERYGCPVIENINIPVEPYVSNSVHCYVHVSDYVRKRFGRLDRWNMTIHPGSDLEVFSRTADQPITDDCIGMIYRLQPDKLNEQAIEPFIRVVRRRPGTKAHIVGGGQFLDYYRRRVTEAGVAEAFTFTGYVPYQELPRHLARMSLFVAPVHTESFGQVSPFAMGMKLPVVGYRTGALEEIIGAPELLAAPGDAERLADIIIDLLDDRSRRLHIGEQNRRRAEELFSLQSMTAGYDALYRDILRTRTRRPISRKERSAIFPRAWAGAQAHDVPTVTVLMAMFNSAPYLREAIDSILTQTFTDFELVIVDDGSTDASRAIVESYADPRIRLLVNGENIGLSRSLNRGLGQSRGRYIARMDADDISEPNRLARQVDFMDRHNDVAVLGSCCGLIDDNGDSLGRRHLPCDDAEIRWALQFCNPFVHSAVMIRRAAAPEGSWYDESLVYAMDYDLWVRLATRGKLANLDEFLVRWRMSRESMTARLGDRTERFDRVVASMRERPQWPAEDAAETERKVGLLCGIVSGSTPKASLEEAEWAVRTLFELHDDFCRRLNLDSATEQALRSTLLRHTARALYWMGHQYPDQQDYGYAGRTLTAAGRLHPPSLLSREGVTLMLKLLGGRPAVATFRRITGRRPGLAAEPIR
jgi:glycosyltransferase involved in cell wall biosynthesis/GT2 family glycosyltransferase